MEVDWDLEEDEEFMALAEASDPRYKPHVESSASAERPIPQRTSSDGTNHPRTSSSTYKGHYDDDSQYASIEGEQFRPAPFPSAPSELALILPSPPAR